MNESPLLRAMREMEAAAAPFPPWRIWEALGVVALFALAQPLVSVGVSLLVGPHLAPGLGGVELEARLIAIVLPLVVLVSHTVGWTTLAWLIIRRHHQRFLAALRLRLATPDGRARPRLVRAFLAGMGLQIVGVLLAGLAPPPEGLESPLIRFAAAGPWAVPALFVMAVVMAPPLEESMFRGTLLPALRRRMAFVPAALLVTALFTALHAVQTGGYWPALAAIAVAGYVMAWLRERTGLLWPSILFHMGFNFTAVAPLLFLPERMLQAWPG